MPKSRSGLPLTSAIAAHNTPRGQRSAVNLMSSSQQGEGQGHARSPALSSPDATGGGLNFGGGDNSAGSSPRQSGTAMPGTPRPAPMRNTSTSRFQAADRAAQAAAAAAAAANGSQASRPGAAGSSAASTPRGPGSTHTSPGAQSSPRGLFSKLKSMLTK